MADKDIKRRISIFINDKEVKNNLHSIGKEIGKLRGQIRHLTPGTDEFIKKTGELKKAKKAYAEVNDEIKDTNISLDEARGHFANIFEGFLSGNPEKVISGVNGIKGSFKGLLQTAKAFVATPIGLALTALAAISFVAKNWVDFNLEVQKSNELVRELTGLSGEGVDAVRIRAEILQETFGTEFQTNVETAKSLVKNFGISYDEAFDLVEDSAVRGKLKNGEFLDSIAEYPIQFKNAGFFAKEFIDIINAGIDLSIYKDKLPDALKEADLALKEQTQASRDALVNAFGASFSDDLLKRISTGKTTTKQALQEIAQQAEKVNLSQQQQAQLTADLFKGAGEDAGGALKIFKALNIALGDQKKPLTENQRLTKQQLELNKELNGVYTQLFASGSEGFGAIIKKGKIFATETLLSIIKGAVNLYNWFIDLNNESVVFSGLLTGVGKAATSGFKILGALISNAWQSIKGLGNVLVGVFTGDLAKIKEGFKQSISFVPETIKDVKNQVVKDANDIYDALQGKNKKKRIDLKTLVANDTSFEETSTGGASSNSAESNAKAIAFAKAEAEIDKLIAKKRAERELAQKQGLAKELAQIEANYSALEEKYAGHKDKLAELEGLKQQELDDAKLAK